MGETLIYLNMMLLIDTFGFNSVHVINVNRQPNLVVDFWYLRVIVIGRCYHNCAGIAHTVYLLQYICEINMSSAIHTCILIALFIYTLPLNCIEYSAYT